MAQISDEVLATATRLLFARLSKRQDEIEEAYKRAKKASEELSISVTLKFRSCPDGLHFTQNINFVKDRCKDSDSTVINTTQLQLWGDNNGLPAQE